MKLFSIQMIVLLSLSFGCSSESENQADAGLTDVTENETDAGFDVSAEEDVGASIDCITLGQTTCLKEEACEWYQMQEVSFENDVCVAGAKVEKCAPSSGTQAQEVFIDSVTSAAIVSPAGNFGDWGNWEGCETKEQIGVCTCSGCLGSEPGACD